jgi:hypothetical protein
MYFCAFGLDKLHTFVHGSRRRIFFSGIHWGVSKIRKTRKKRCTSFRKKKYIFFEKDAKRVGGFQKLPPPTKKMQIWF